MFEDAEGFWHRIDNSKLRYKRSFHGKNSFCVFGGISWYLVLSVIQTEQNLNQKGSSTTPDTSYNHLF